MYIVDYVPGDLTPLMPDLLSPLVTATKIVYRYCPLSPGQGARSLLRMQVLGRQLSLFPEFVNT